MKISYVLRKFSWLLRPDFKMILKNKKYEQSSGDFMWFQQTWWFPSHDNWLLSDRVVVLIWAKSDRGSGSRNGDHTWGGEGWWIGPVLTTSRCFSFSEPTNRLCWIPTEQTVAGSTFQQSEPTEGRTDWIKWIADQSTNQRINRVFILLRWIQPSYWNVVR